jgi:hypothetical protein
MVMLATIQSRTSFFSSAVENPKHQNIRDYHVACGSTLLEILISDIKGGSQTESI